ncbi:MAG: AbrB/MazE/SpoVT family DNA-binding domain-containing protein [Bryobacteraceae bacterium]
MSLVTVKNKFQVVIPQQVREELGINMGDVLEARADNGRLVFVPKTVLVLDRDALPSADEYTPQQREQINARLKEARKGPFYGPFRNGQEVAKFLKGATATRKPAKKTKPSR